ncbi:MAG: putative peptidoglycan glycosyltransferase FtsW [Patescibacteria group bacterium]|nr:putative peptidoglycan glycosyltransferase FtsW [Patescibacteria group bacterium]
MRSVENHWFKKIFLFIRNIEGADRWLLFSLAGLIVFGLIALSSASSVIAFQNTGDSFFYIKKQLIGILIGFVFFAIAIAMNWRQYKKYGWLLFLFNIILLIVVLIFGYSAGGSRAWIRLGGFNIQPSEFLKLTLLLYLAARLSRPEKEVSHKIIPFLIVYGLAALLIMLQPDIGTLFIISVPALVSLFVAKAPLKHIFFLIGIGVVLLSSIFLISKFTGRLDHAQGRFECIIGNNIETNKQGTCYQVSQSLSAIGSGKVIGRGLGESRKKFRYIPEVQNDFIFSVIAEETGFIFSSLLIILYAFIFWRSYLIAAHSNEPFVKILSISIGSWFVAQAIINIGGATVVLPLTGVPLPFVSYGGSAMISSLAAAGVLVGLSKNE